MEELKDNLLLYECVYFNELKQLRSLSQCKANTHFFSHLHHKILSSTIMS